MSEQRKALLRCVLIIVLLLLSLSSVPAAEVLPLQLPPTNLAELLGEPARTIRLIQADSLSVAQQQVLCNSISNCGEPTFNDYTKAVCFAIEEYYLRELTYPADASRLIDSGYLDECWFSFGYTIVSFNNRSNDYNSNEIVYIPQPIGLTELECVPGRPCVITMRCFREYSLAIASDSTQDRSLGNKEQLTWWFKPFNGYGLKELLHMDQTKLNKAFCLACGH